MQRITKEWLEFLREQYPEGSRIQLKEMNDPYHPVEPGTMGTLRWIDDMGQFHVNWDNGRTLALIIGEDRFTVIPPAPQELKFYMPLTGDFYGYDDWGDLEEYGSDLTGRELMDYEASIREAIRENQMPEEKERGLMRWYDKTDGVNGKVRSVVFDVESRNGQLWGVARCQVNGTLSPEEKEILADYISGQASDGWGEGFEQRKIRVNEGELYVSLWNAGNWTIQTEQEQFSPDSLDRLPDLCWSVLPSTGNLICIKKGESGYYPSGWDTGDREQNQRIIEDLGDKKISSTELVNCLPDGKIQTVNSMKYPTREIKSKYGIMFKYHYLRHTYGTMMAEMNTPTHLLCNQMGHGNIQVTQRYYIAISRTGVDILKDNLNHL